MKKLGLASLIAFQSIAMAATNGVTDKEVMFGAHTSESGVFAVFGVNSRGVQAYIDDLNERGGVNGRKVKWERIDTQGVILKTIQSTKKLVEEDKVFGMFASMGASHQSIRKYLEEKQIPDVFFFDGLAEYGPAEKYFFPGQSSYAIEGETLAKIAAKFNQGKKGCFLITDNAIGEEFYNGVKKGLESENKKLKPEQQIKIGVVEKVDRVATNPNSSILKLKQENCDLVFNVILGALSGNAITYASLQGFKPVWLVPTQSANDKFIELLPDGSKDGVYSSTSIAMNADFGTPGWNKYKEVMEKKGVPVSKLSVAGYTMGELLEETLKKAGKNLTHESFLKAAESLDGFKCSLCLKPVKYSAKTHWGFSDPTWIVSKAGKWVKLD